MAEAELLKQALQGNGDALEEIVRLSWWDLYRFVYGHVQNREEAEDVTQETYARLLAAMPRLRAEGALSGLLRTIAVNIIRDRWRRRRVRGPSLPLDLAPQPAGPDETAQSIRRMAIRDALARLPDDQRRVIELRILQGYSLRETAEMTDKTEAAVRSLQFRGLRRLAGLLEGDI